MPFPQPSPSSPNLNRRSWLQAAAMTSTAMLDSSPLSIPSRAALASFDPLTAPVDPRFRIQRNQIKQSIMGWTFNPMPTPELARHCKEIGLVAMEGIDRSHYPLIRQLGLAVSLVSSHGFAKGPLNPAHHAFVEEKLREAIDVAESVNCQKVITFTGMREPGISDSTASRNCLECWKRVIPYAEKKKITLCLEHLNSRDNSHPMKGHPGYFGDDVELCIDLVKKVDSPSMKLLFDIYHVQIMHGDVISRIRQHHPFIGHYHTAGVPGRGELDGTQEINYPAVLRAILETGYSGFVAQEFIPTWPDKIAALRHAAFVCDI